MPAKGNRKLKTPASAGVFACRTDEQNEYRTDEQGIQNVEGEIT
jgi:hypothetical protein